MKRTPEIIIYAILLTTFSACQSTIMRIGGLKPPKIENSQSINAFLKKVGRDTVNVLSLDTTLFLDLQSKSFKPGWKPAFRPVQIRVYNSSYAPIMHWASCEGHLKKLGTFNQVPPKNLVNLDSTLNLPEDIDRYYNLQGNPANVIPVPGYDYYIVVYFSQFPYRMSKQIIRQIDEYTENNPDYKFKVYLVNTDVMDWWNTELVSEITIH